MKALLCWLFGHTPLEIQPAFMSFESSEPWLYDFEVFICKRCMMLYAKPVKAEKEAGSK